MNQTITTVLSSVSLLLSGVCCVLLLRTEPVSVPVPVAAANPALEQRLEELQREIELMRERPVPAAPASADSGLESRREATAAHDARLAEIERQLANLTKVQQQLQTAAAARSTDQRLPNSPAEREAEQAVRREKSSQTFLSLSASENERLLALRELRGLGKGARGGAVADAAIRLVQSSSDPKIRADVWRQMSRANEEVLVPYLIQSLQFDADPEVREEAAETLGDYPTHGDAVAALRAASENDAEQRVRQQCKESLAGRR